MLHRTEALVREGIGPVELRRMVKAGDLVKVRHGVYADLPLTGDRKRDHLTLARAVALRLGDNKVFSHQTAGILHDLPVWRKQLNRVAATRDGRSGGRRESDLIIRAAKLPDTDVTQVDGLQVTTLARTAADLARAFPLLWGLPVIDAALRKGVSAEELTAQAEAATRWPGVRTLKAALDLGDAGAESPGESMSRLVLSRLGIPAPELQADILHSSTGKLLGRADFCWRDQRIIGEFDGQVKYSAGVDADELGEVVMREKRREHDLRADGWQVIRWVWAELFEPNSILGQWLVACRNAA